MLVLHLSDLHLSRYGETGTWSAAESEERPGEVLHVWERWEIEGLRSRRKNRPAKLRLVDPEGVVHKTRNWPKRGDDKAIDRLLALAMERHETSAERLIESSPSPEDLQALLRLDPANTNLRFLEMLDQVLRVEPELIVITGDITDNGFGYGLVRHYLAPWIESQRLLAVPGNHDTYDMIPRKGRKQRAAAKEERFRAFAAGLGLTLGDEGAWVHRIEDVALVGLNSCKPPRTPLSASGAVSKEQLRWLGELGAEPELRTARLRIGLVHHHLLRMPFALGKRSPIEVGMRLRNAPDVMRACTSAGLDILLHGHRHHGYMVQLPAHPMVVSSPSSTMGCKFARRDYTWVMDLDRNHPHPLMHDFQGLRASMAPNASVFNQRLDKLS